MQFGRTPNSEFGEVPEERERKREREGSQYLIPLSWSLKDTQARRHMCSEIYQGEIKTLRLVGSNEKERWTK